MKGNATCHTTSKKYREGWERVFAPLVPRPDDAPPKYQNEYTTTRCDMDRGPCACGAWH